MKHQVGTLGEGCSGIRGRMAGEYSYESSYSICINHNGLEAYRVNINT